MEDDFEPECAEEGAPDVAILWTPSLSGCYTLDTEGSDFDTTLSLMDYSGEPTCSDVDVIECDDDDGSGTTSSLSYSATGGVSVLIVIDGYEDDDDGDYVLNIGLCPDP